MQLDQVKVKADVENIHKNVDELLKVVRDGNGKPSLLARISELESYKEGLEKKEEKEKSISAEHTKGKWAIRAAIATGILSILGTLFQHFFK